MSRTLCRLNSPACLTTNNACMHACMHAKQESMDGWMDGWMDGCMGGWVYCYMTCCVCIYIYIYISARIGLISTYGFTRLNRSCASVSRASCLSGVGGQEMNLTHGDRRSPKGPSNSIVYGWLSKLWSLFGSLL